jgi:F-type H+-transporting ATPase subunit b
MHLLAFAETIQLFPDGTIFIHIALILVMMWVLNRTFYKPINRIITEREKNKGGRSSEAVGILSKVDEKEALYTKEMLAARSSGYELIEKEQKKSAAARDKQLREAKEKIAAEFESNKADLDRRESEARSTIAVDAEKIAEQIATNILKG